MKFLMFTVRTERVTFMPKCGFYSFCFSNMEVNGYCQLSGNQHFSNYFLLCCSTEERNSYRFGTTWKWV